ncbi:sensor histidine kinase [Pigmentiphaga aceris]|uniref:sensor histidine kinase n=1 Tax=Pigmentiphaga aceris TaxID=1940612 RepID=UPI001FEA04F2|nr:extracellular solute-binding protein [Pigmentiphaga aceris]
MKRSEQNPLPAFRRAESLSIRGRVFSLAISLLVGGGLALLIFLESYATQAADRAFDRLLAASALTIAGAVQTEDDGVALELPIAALGMLSDSERVFYSVRDASGGLVTGYGDLEATLAPANSSVPVFANMRYRGDEVRIATVGRLLSTGPSIGWVTIRVAETRGARRQLAAEIFQRSALPLLAIVVVALGLLWFGIQRAFAPLSLIEQELRSRAPGDLAPLKAPVPREVLQLTEALDSFMGRLRAVMAVLQNLVADAAHQVRTPLASLRAQAEVMTEETDPVRLRERAGRVLANASHVSLLINQLLMDATITHRLDAQTRDAVGVSEIINDTRRRIGMDGKRRLRIAIAPQVRRARIRGDKVALREMLRNLVDNALQYAPDGEVDIEAQALPGGRVLLSVSDRGPGIQEDEKDTVLERFQRGRSAQGLPGSGLGLAIVRNVVDAHGGSLSLRARAGGGLVVSVMLPLAAPAAAGRAKTGVFAALALAIMVWTTLPQVVQAQANTSTNTSTNASTNTQAKPATPGAPAVPTTADGTLATVPAGLAARGPGALSSELSSVTGPTAAGHVTIYPAPQKNLLDRTVSVAGPTDTVVFTEIARQFQRSWPDVTVVYRELNGFELYREVIAGKLPSVDVLVSSSIDLQVRLANDGYALPHVSRHAEGVPAWARWRTEVFGFTFEPIVIVYNPKRFTPDTVPHSRQALLNLLETQLPVLDNRVGSYDIATSGLAYLLASQDAVVSSNFWGLANALGRAHVHLHSTAAAILDEIESGELDLAYNVLGSYALAREAAGRPIAVAMPQDYVAVLSRSALILRTAPTPEMGRAFVDWLLSPAGQETMAGPAALGSIVPGTSGRWTSESLMAGPHGIVQPIVFGSALLVGLDQQRHARFVKNWRRLVTDSPEASQGYPAKRAR